MLVHVERICCEDVLVDEKGREISERYRRIDSFHNGRAIVETSTFSDSYSRTKFGYINTRGKEVITAIYENARPFKNGEAEVLTKGNFYKGIPDSWDIIDKNGHTPIRIFLTLMLKPLGYTALISLVFPWVGLFIVCWIAAIFLYLFLLERILERIFCFVLWIIYWVFYPFIS